MKTARQLDVLTIGAATRDIFVASDHFERVLAKTAPDGYNACVPLGSKISVDMMDFQTGGGATNAAVTFARQGFTTGCIARVGKDASGKDVVEELKKEKVMTDAMQIDAKKFTGHSIILLSGHGSRAILTERGASKMLDAKLIQWKTLKTKWIYLTSLSGNMASLKRIFADAKKQRVQIAWNPGNAEIAFGLKTLLPYLLQADIVMMNREEAADLVGTAPRMMDKVMARLGHVPRQVLVITDGAAGAYAHSRGVTWHVAGLKGKRINTTGAGDAFGSGFVASVIKDGDVVKALQAASVNAFGVVSHMGAKRGILKRKASPKELLRATVREVSRV